MANTMSITFLGTSSGGGPSASRNCSSLVADFLGNGTLWMVDCAEGTLRQFQQQPWSVDRSKLRLSQVKKIFITHMHADHVMGIIPILRNVLFPVPVGEDAQKQLETLRKPHPTIEIYGPAGIRTFVRSILKMTLSKMTDRYVVHELLTRDNEVTSTRPEDMHVNEVAGQDIVCSSDDGFWRDVTQGQGVYGPVLVEAGPISHRGYVFRETTEPFRKIVILGDTDDPSAMVPLCTNPSPSILIHEATDAHSDIDPKAKRSYETVKAKALARGHSIPEMAGSFAKTIGARKLVLNHIGGRFPAPHPSEGGRISGIRANVIAEIERQASEAWGMGSARAAWDFMRVAIPPPGLQEPLAPDANSQSLPATYPTASNTSSTTQKPHTYYRGNNRNRTSHSGHQQRANNRANNNANRSYRSSEQAPP